MNAQKESLKKNFQGLRKLPYAHEKVCNENKETRKNDARVKIFWWKEALYKAHTKKNDLNKLRVNDSGHNK